MPKGISGNAGKKDEVVFTKKHPFFKIFDKKARHTNKEQRNLTKNVINEFDDMILNTDIGYGQPLTFKNKSRFYINSFNHIDDFEANFRVATLFAKQYPKTDIRIRPDFSGRITNIGKNKNSNPEFLINGQYAE